MELSKRLQAVADMVTVGNRLVDVGTDHGMVPIFLVKSGRISGAIATDVKPGPLSRAEEHIAEWGMQEYIKTRLSDGLKEIAAGEGDTLLLAGMGGHLMLKILTEGRDILSSFQELVLQPQSVLHSVRKGLFSLNWRVTEEHMILEDGKFYPMMRLLPGKDSYSREIEFYYGRLLLQEKNPVLEQYLKDRKKVYEQLHARLSGRQTDGESPSARKRLIEIEEELKRLQEALGRFT